MDEELMKQIKEVARMAEEMSPKGLDLRTIAVDLAAKYGNHTANEIEEQMHLVFRQAGLFWRD